MNNILGGRDDVAHQPMLVPKTRKIALSCGTKISAVCVFILSQRVTDGRTESRQLYCARRAVKTSVKSKACLEGQCVRILTKLAYMVIC